MQKQISDEMLELVAQRLRLLSDPMRLKILHQLQSGERSVSELVELTKASQPNVSKHLSGLRTHGLVKRRQEGNIDRKSTRLNSSHVRISYAVFCLKKK